MPSGRVVRKTSVPLQGGLFARRSQFFLNSTSGFAGVRRVRKFIPAKLSSDHGFVKAESVEVFASTALWVPRSLGTAFSTLGASPEPLTFIGIDARLQISDGSICQRLQLLRFRGAISLVDWGDGPSAHFHAHASRRYCNSPELNLRRLAGSVLHERVNRSVFSGSERVIGIRKLAEQAGKRRQLCVRRSVLSASTTEARQISTRNASKKGRGRDADFSRYSRFS